MPIVSAGGWFLLAFLQVYRDRWHTWTETFFLFACFFAGLYAIGDWLFFQATQETALFAALISFTGLTLATNFFLLFTLVYVDRMRTWYWAFMIVSFGMLIMLWTPNVTIARIIPPPNSGALYVPQFHPIPFGIYLIYTVVYGVAGIRNLYRLFRIVQESSKALARRAFGLMITFTAVLILGLVTNGLLGILGNTDIPPPFSTLLIFVAGMAYYTLYPVGRERISEAIRRFQSRRYSIKAIFLTYEDGTLIGAKVRPGESVVDQDLFGATLDVIQNFMRTSFPILRGKSLSSISHGSYTLVMERARHAYLTVVLEGEESDQLRRQMRDQLLAFEAKNRQVLTRWQGIPSEATGTEELFSEFFMEPPAT
ncbi:MAG TPA: hypothetical protein VEO20_11295 [Thermoplasmata archaeon]|nr:hypothetical protein [Thermoplasmata archaeon]